MKNVSAWCGVVLALGWPCLALGDRPDTFQADASLFHSRFEDSTDRSRTTGVLGTYYFNPLPLRPLDYPLGAEAFVERSASISLDYTRGAQYLDGARRRAWSYGAQAIFRRPDMPLYGAAAYSYYDGERFRSSFGTELDSYGKSYELAAGAYVARNTLLFLDWERSVSRSVNYLSSGTFSFESVTRYLGASAQHLAPLANGQHLAVFPRVERERRTFSGGNEETNNTFTLDATYYPTRSVGLSAGLDYKRGDSRFSEGETWRVGANWFIVPTVCLLLNFVRFEANAPDFDYDVIGLAAFIRF